MNIYSFNHGKLTFAGRTKAALLILGSLVVSAAHGNAWQSLDSIARAAIEHAEANVTVRGARVASSVKALDPRLKLAKCGKPLQAFSPSHASGLRRNTTVGVRCTSPKAWKVYVPVRMTIYRKVLVANHPLHRGDNITSADVRVDERDVATLKSTYLTNITQLDGKVLRRSVPEGTLVTLDLLNAERIIRRGQSVTLMIEHHGLKVRMAGTAMADGTVDQRIRVKNLSSKRVVEGIVRSSQLVEVVL